MDTYSMTSNLGLKCSNQISTRGSSRLISLPSLTHAPVSTESASFVQMVALNLMVKTSESTKMGTKKSII